MFTRHKSALLINLIQRTLLRQLFNLIYKTYGLAPFIFSVFMMCTVLLVVMPFAVFKTALEGNLTVENKYRAAVTSLACSVIAIVSFIALQHVTV